MLDFETRCQECAFNLDIVLPARPDLYKRYMDDVAGAASGSEQDLQHFLDFASMYHPKLVYIYVVYVF